MPTHSTLYTEEPLKCQTSLAEVITIARIPLSHLNVDPSAQAIIRLAKEFVQARSSLIRLAWPQLRLLAHRSHCTSEKLMPKTRSGVFMMFVFVCYSGGIMLPPVVRISSFSFASQVFIDAITLEGALWLLLRLYYY